MTTLSTEKATNQQQKKAYWQTGEIITGAGVSTVSALANQSKCSVGKHGQVLYHLGDKVVTGNASGLKLKTKTEQDIKGSLHIATALGAPHP